MRIEKEFTRENSIRTMFEPISTGEENNEGKVAIIAMEHLSEEYRKPKYQLYRLTGGFGCKPSGSGRKCYGVFCVDGSSDIFDKYAFIGIADEATTKIAEELESEWNGGSSGSTALEKDDDALEM